jgi:hypothetical protein
MELLDMQKHAVEDEDEDEAVDTSIIMPILSKEMMSEKWKMSEYSASGLCSHYNRFPKTE